MSGLNMMAPILNNDQVAKLKIVGGVITKSNQQEADQIRSYITSVIVS